MLNVELRMVKILCEHSIQSSLNTCLCFLVSFLRSTSITYHSNISVQIIAMFDLGMFIVC